MIVKLLVEGGEMKPSPAISQKLGPLGLNLGRIMQEVNKATAEFKGIKVPVTLDIDTKTKNFTVKVSTPPVSGLLKKEFGLEKASGDINNIKVANAAMEQVISIAKIKQPDMLANNFKAVVKSVLGTCQSLGILVENKTAKEALEELSQGKYDDAINSQKTELSEEKKAELNKYFEDIKVKQEEMIKKKAEEEAAKEKEAAAPAEGAEAGEAAAPAAKASAKETKTEAKAAKGEGKAEGKGKEKK